MEIKKEVLMNKEEGSKFVYTDSFFFVNFIHCTPTHLYTLALCLYIINRNCQFRLQKKLFLFNILFVD